MELYEKVREKRNSLNFFARKLGITITKIEKNYAEGQLTVDESFTNPQGSVQGGAMFTLADAVGGAAAGCNGIRIATVDASFHYLRPGLHTSLLKARTRLVKSGSTLAVLDVSVYDQDDTLLSEGIFTYILMKTTIFD
ncbi:MAG: PaaI family thioesterase [Lachnospiraceae bacterium]|nr:PaaI family thioesterase [Lachnospiraceae bacterium]